jgi:hypothetical protein
MEVWILLSYYIEGALLSQCLHDEALIRCEFPWEKNSEL